MVLTTDEYVHKITIDNEGFGSKLNTMSTDIAMFASSSIASLIAVAAATALVTKALTDAAAKADEINDLAYATGATAEQIQKLQYAAKLSGESTEFMTGQVNKLSLAMGKAKDEGSEASAAFAKLGISADDLKGKNVQEVYFMVAAAMENVKDAGDRATITQQLLGKNANEITPFLHEVYQNQEKINEAMYQSEGAIGAASKQYDNLNKFLADVTGAVDYFLGLYLQLDQTIKDLNPFGILFGKASEAAGTGAGGRAGSATISASSFKPNPAAGASSSEKKESVGKTAATSTNKMASGADLFKAGYTAADLKYAWDSGNIDTQAYNELLVGFNKAAAGQAVAGSTWTAGSTGWDQGMVSPGQYWAEGVQPNMGVMGATSAPTEYQKQVAASLYQGYYDQLTGDKWGQQKYREEIARQMALNEAVKGYKTQEEAWSAAGYNPKGNITIINYNSLTNDETLAALAEEISRVQATNI